LLTQLIKKRQIHEFETTGIINYYDDNKSDFLLIKEYISERSDRQWGVLDKKLISRMCPAATPCIVNGCKVVLESLNIFKQILAVEKEKDIKRHCHT